MITCIKVISVIFVVWAVLDIIRILGTLCHAVVMRYVFDIKTELCKNDIMMFVIDITCILNWLEVAERFW